MFSENGGSGRGKLGGMMVRPRFEIAAMSDTGKMRDVNEDQALAEQLYDGSVLLAVADGVGGMAGGDLASKEAIDALRDELREPGEDPASALARAFFVANERVRGLVPFGAQPVATTLVAALVRGERAWLANVGDSRAYLYRGERLEQLTRDHSLVAEQVSAGVLTAKQAEASAYANVITRGIGVEEEVMVDAFGPVDLWPGSVLLLCSDGLYRVVDDHSIVEVLTSSSIGQAPERLVSLANAAGGPDNIAVAVCRRS